MGYDLLRLVDIDLGEIGDSIQIDLNKEKSILRITLFKENHYQDEIEVDLLVYDVIRSVRETSGDEFAEQILKV